MKNTPDFFASQIRRPLGPTALLLFALIAASSQLHAQRRYALDSTPNVAMRSADTAFVDQVIGLPDGHVLVIGSSKYVNGVEHPQTGIVRLDSSGRIDPTFVAPAGHVITNAAATPSGGIWALGDFSGTASNSVVKLTANGALASGFTPISAAAGNHLVALPDNGFYLFDGSSGIINVRRFGPDGLPAPGFTTVVANASVFLSTASSTGQIALTAGITGPSGVQVYDATGAALPNATAGIPANFQATGVAFDNLGAMVLSGATFPEQDPC